MKTQVLSVSQAIGEIKKTLETPFRNITIEGEVSNFSFSNAGHYYFSLKDENAIISCALFRGQAMRNPFIRQVKDGMKVLLHGDLSVYEKRGSFQVIGKKILLREKRGNLKEQFERLKKKLFSEGLFALERKRKIPHFPRKVGVVTALRGAALQDFLNILNRRSASFHVLISPALVQGVNAPDSIIKALENLKGLKGVDVVVLMRGGGSLEDLWSFNEERLIRYLEHYPIPFISGVGHQTDFTLCDYIADKRVETPSAVAELLSSVQVQYIQRFEFMKSELLSTMELKLRTYQKKISGAKPLELVTSLKEKKFLMEQRVQEAFSFFEKKIPRDVEKSQISLERSFQELQDLCEKKYERSERSLSELFFFLEKLHPNQILKKGYTYIEDGGRMITSKKDFSSLEKGKKLNIYFKDGKGEVEKC